MKSALYKARPKMELKIVQRKNAPVSPGAFVFCERSSGAIRFQVEAAGDGALPVEQAASLLAMHCLARGQAPADYTVLVVPRSSLLDPVDRRAEELLGAWKASGTEVALSSREQQVLQRIIQNLSNKEIGNELNITERTVKFHVSALLSKFNVRDRFSLVRQATLGMIPAATAPTNSLFGFPVPAK